MFGFLLPSMIAAILFFLPVQAWVMMPEQTAMLSSRYSLLPLSVSSSPPNTHETTTTTAAAAPDLLKSVNYFISRKCNYHCHFCFHTQKTNHNLSLEQAQHGLRLLQQAGTEKINFAGGEPLLHAVLLGELCRTASHELGMAVSIITNGSLLTQKWMQTYGPYVDIMGVSVDSFCPATNLAIGRHDKAAFRVVNNNNNNNNHHHLNNHHNTQVLRVREWCSQYNIQFKMNTVVNCFNWQEDMNQQVHELDPIRWKVFQVLVLEGENAGQPGELRNAKPLQVSDEEFASFVNRHASLDRILIPEPNTVMQNSYLLLDEEMRFLDCSQGGKVPSKSILDVGVEQALLASGFDKEMFDERGGVYDWSRRRDKSRRPPPQNANGSDLV